MSITVRCLLICVFFFSGVLRADWNGLTEGWRWSTFDTGHGLPSKRVYAIVEMPGDLVWAATARGMSWFDGFQWHPVTADLGLPAEQVTVAIADRDTNLLVVQGSRLFYGNRAGFTAISDDSAHQSSPFVHGAQLSRGRFLLLTNAGTLWLLSGTHLTPVAGPPLQHQARIIEIRRASDGRIWANTTRGLFIGDGVQWQQFLDANGGPMEIASFAENALRDGAAWVVHPEERIGLWTWKRGGPPLHVVSEPVSSLPRLMVGPQGDVIHIEESGRVSTRTRNGARSLPQFPVEFIGSTFAQFRPNGDLWVGGSGGLHLCRLSSHRWEYLRRTDTGRASRVHDILLRRDSSVWVATASGIEIYRPDGSSSAITTVDGFPLGVVTGLAEDPAGMVWATSGVSFTGAIRWDGLRWRRFGPADGLDQRLYHRVLQDKAGRLWFLGLETPTLLGGVSRQKSGVFVYVRGRFVRWGDDHAPLHRSTYTLAEGADSSFWFGTNTGLSQWSRRSWRRWTTADGLRSNRVFTLAVDRTGVVWFGDQTNGVGRLERGQVSYLTTADGLLDDAVWEIETDESGKLWIATRGGLNSYARGTWATFDLSSGLNHTALWPVLRAGNRVFLGTSGGGTAILQLPSDREHVPRVVFDPPVYDDGVLCVQWKALGWWESPGRGLETRYQLDGGSWSAWSDQNSVRLDAASSGDHVLQVQAKDLFARYDPRGSGVRLNIEGPALLRPVVYLPLAALALAILALVSVMAQRQAHHRREVRTLEETSRILLDAAPDTLYLLDPLGRIIAMNQAARHLPETPPIGSCLFDILPAPLAASRRAALEQVLSTKEPLVLEEQHDGRFYEHSIRPVLDGSGRLRRIALSSRDITDRRQLEGTMRSTVQFLRQILESSTTVAIISTDRQGTILFWNTGASNLLGHIPEEMVGRKSLSALLPAGEGEGQEELMQTMMSVLGERETVVRVLSVVHQDGRIRKIRVTISPQTDAGGMVQGMLVIGEDMTEQEAARRETEQAERLLRLLAFTLNCAKDAFVVTDLDNVILYVNQAFLEMYGYMEEELLGVNVMIVRSHANPPALTEQILVATRNAGWSGEILNRRKNGEEFPVELWTSTVTNELGEAVALVGVSREITERKRAEDQIRSSLREKEVLLKEIHHRVKNNLQVITSLLSLQAGKLANVEMQAILKESQTRVKSMALVHEELYQSDDLSRVDFADYIRRLTTNLFHTYQTGPVPISLLVEVEEIFLAVDTAIPCGLIINELVSNALRHAFKGKNGGTVTITLQRDGAVHVLTVADDGIGLPDTIDPGSTETLGLQLVSTLTRQLGGVLVVTREQGTKFEIQFVEHQQQRAGTARSMYGGQG